MIDFALNENGTDIAIVKADLTLVNDVDDIVQNILIRLRWFKGEYVFDISLGVSYFEDILVANPNLQHIGNLIKAEIVKVEGVLSITSFASKLDRVLRSLSISFECNTIYGETGLIEV